MKKTKSKSQGCRAGKEPALTGSSDSLLNLSVLLSSSDLTISELLLELWAIRTFAIDIYPRGKDIRESCNYSRDDLEGVPLIERFSDKKTIHSFAEYIKNQTKNAVDRIQTLYGIKVPINTFRIPAIATFFPELSSLDEKNAVAAGKALRGAVELANKLGIGVVEFVIGRTVERCHRPPREFSDKRHRCDYIHTSDPIDRINVALDILDEYVVPFAEQSKVKLAAEIEPGFSYILNGRTNIDAFINRVLKKGMGRTVGLNLDIGHLLILGNSGRREEIITPEIAGYWKDHIYHAHISDNIGYHFRDLVPGVYHNLYPIDESHSFYQWIKLCAECSLNNKGFSKYIAVELEGCNRIQWVQRSLLRLAYIIREVNQGR